MAATTSLKLEPDLKERVERIAEAKERSAHWIMKRAIEEYVGREEEHAAVKRELERRLRSYEDTGLHLTNDEVVDWLDRRIAGEDVRLPKAHK